MHKLSMPNSYTGVHLSGASTSVPYISWCLTHTHIHMHTHIHTYMHTLTHARTRAHTNTSPHTHMLSGVDLKKKNKSGKTAADLCPEESSALKAYLHEQTHSEKTKDDDDDSEFGEV